MIHNFFVYNRESVEALEPHDVPHVIISVSTPDDPRGQAKLKTDHHTRGVLRLQFQDRDRILHDADNNVLFNETHAQLILSFVAAHPDAERLNVHCDAGYSRSPAIAAALSKILVGDDRYFFQRYRPNMLVYRRILEAHYGNVHEDETGERTWKQ